LKELLSDKDLLSYSLNYLALVNPATYKNDPRYAEIVAQAKGDGSNDGFVSGLLGAAAGLSHGAMFGMNAIREPGIALDHLKALWEDFTFTGAEEVLKIMQGNIYGAVYDFQSKTTATGVALGTAWGTTRLMRDYAGAVGNATPSNVSVTTAIDGSFTVIDQLPLPQAIKNTFINGNYFTIETTAPITVYRKFGGTGNQAKANGGFATTIENASRSETAVFQQWSNQRFEAKFNIPEGTTLNIGKAAPQTSRSGNRIYHQGGADQVLLPQDYPVSWITSIRDGKTGIIYTLEEFQKVFPDQFK
jgi:hypothetical protein